MIDILYGTLVSDRVQSAVQWEQAEGEHWNNGIKIILIILKL